MTEETQAQEAPQEDQTGPLANLAADTFGGEYHGGDDSEDRDEQERPEGTLTLDDAYSQMQEAKDEAAIESDDGPTDQPDEGQPQQWQGDDQQTLAAFQQAEAQLVQDLQIYQHVEQRAAELDKTDKAQAAALRAELRDAQKELKSRYEALNQAATGYQTNAINRHVTTTYSAAVKEAPELNHEVLDRYLEAEGLGQHDARWMLSSPKAIVFAEKARLYDEMMGNQRKPKGKVPTTRKKAPPESKGSPQYREAMDRAHRTGFIDDWATVHELKKQGQGPSKTKRGPTTEQEALNRHRKAPSIDSALDVMRARRENAA